MQRNLKIKLIKVSGTFHSNFNLDLNVTMSFDRQVDFILVCLHSFFNKIANFLFEVTLEPYRESGKNFHIFRTGILVFIKAIVMQESICCGSAALLKYC